MQASLEVLGPRLKEAGVKPCGHIVIETVGGDLHDIGRDLVIMMLEGAGFEVIDLRVGITAEQFVEAVKERHPRILAMSALPTTTMIYMPKVIEALQDAGLRETTKVVVGGAPVTQEYADEIGADDYAKDAAAAVRLARKLI